ncbi:fad--containing protein [Fusarium langsethiae]|uniref:ferric-chelate reductase (NADPH) n=1 Tax=Fusarium langsethiae TaxID=179993 RepID=A0A0N0V650_FUSLA|nr:fad--containing protein [Fusarium langsethiae]
MIHANNIEAASLVGALALTSIPALWRWVYEFLSYLHLALAATGVIESVTTASIQQIGHGVEIQVSMPRPLKYRAGQFVFLSIPRLAAFQFHPFQVAWEYLSDSGRQVVVFVVQPRHGFTGRLRLAKPMKEYTAFIEGPYGSPTALDQYGTVLLFATGIGIAGQLPYMREQLHLYRKWRTKTRRHVLFWEMDAEGLDIQLYVRGQFLAKDAEKGVSVKKGESLLRLTLNYFPMEPESLIHSEIQRCEGRGRMLVSLCTDPSTAQIVTKVVRPLLGDDLDLVELDFCPWSGSRRPEESISELYKGEKARKE